MAQTKPHSHFGKNTCAGKAELRMKERCAHPSSLHAKGSVFFSTVAAREHEKWSGCVLEPRAPTLQESFWL